MVAGVIALSGCDFLVPDGEGEPGPTPRPVPTRSATAAPAPAPPASGSPSAGPRPAGCSSGQPEVAMGEVQAALGHRAVGLTLTNCGKDPYQVFGYPSVQALGTDGKVLDVWVKRGSSYMGADKGPTSVILAPGESVRSLLSWTSNPKTGRLQQASALAIAPAAGEKARTFPLEGSDVRTVDELTLTAWHAAATG
ncbi:DUF4232 domain-containing protein [Streptomyces sp. ISL-96]|uniref:DUF4232 domain-containing protein n=1 Tax=Streptomyces sp. ISL-96 TaxID=2819191 RepID=UPI001BE8667B|nr:DUF4232 domain-containing protein [Streptomyces sp. ISL-96]MBT2488738.1 DUF4232 domain-containing protein [Streptomyces sp. ISL-96]